MEYKEDDYLMLSGIQHFKFCRRQWALIHIEQQWAENVHTVIGELMHKKVHDPMSKEKRKDTIIVRALPIASRKMGISGECDVVEFHKCEDGISLYGHRGSYSVFPVEHKKGKPKITGEDKLYFYDAAAPIISKDSINFDIAFYGNRYEQEKKKDESIEEWKKRQKEQEKSYINLPMTKEEYENFWNAIVNAEVATLHDFEKREIFEGCMPIEVMAKRGIDTLRFGPLKPVGFDDLRTAKRPYAVVQLRQDNLEGTIYNMVGFQTNLKFGEQKRIFSMIPGLENAEFVKYGVMHRNTYINSTKLLDDTYNLKSNSNVYFAGQITGVEGYVESISSGMVAALNAIKQFEKTDKNQLDDKVVFSKYTVIGALAKYISTENDRFQPMNANFGILPELEGKKIKDKKERYMKLAERSLKTL